MNELIKKFKNKFGYEPSLIELQGLWRSGGISLTDRQEDELISALEAEGLM